jgi:hypothetical protein
MNTCELSQKYKLLKELVFNSPFLSPEEIKRAKELIEKQCQDKLKKSLI